MQTLWQDLKFAVRMLRKNPGFTAVAMLTLALGIGANTAIFSVVNTVLLQPLPYGDSARLLYVSGTDRQSGTTGIPVSFTKFTAVSEQSTTLESSATFFSFSPSLVTERGPELVNGMRASKDFFHVLRVTPAMGRTFLPEEDETGGNDVVLLSDGFWQSHFAGDRNIIGKVLLLDGKSTAVIGVLPASFRFPQQFPEPDVWVPRVTDTPVARRPRPRRGSAPRRCC